MNILGLNAYHADSPACLIHDRQLIAAAEEDCFYRAKHLTSSNGCIGIGLLLY